MGIHDRDYYRKDRRSGRDVLAWFETPVGLLLGLNIACYAAQILGGPQVTSFLAASADEVFGWGFWKLLTANFVHADAEPMHIIGNMFFLFVLGREVEAVYTRRDFFILYLGAGILAVLAEVLVLRSTGRGHVLVLGASGAVMAIVVVCALLYPNKIVHVMFFLPAPLWLLCAIFVLLDLSGTIRGEAGVAHFAHLAGAAVGLIYQRLDLRWGQWSSGAARGRRPRTRVKVIPMPRRRESPVTGDGADPISERIDALLAKISAEGKESLTPEEWEFLKESSSRYRSR